MVRKYLIIILALIPIGLWTYKSVPKKVDAPPNPAELLAIENALATSKLVGLWHFNAAYAFDVFDSFSGGGDPEALPTFAENDGTSFLDVLRRSDVDVQNSVHHVLGGFLADEKTVGSVKIVLGNFDPEDLSDHWKEMDGFKRVDDVNGNPVWTFAPMDIDSCKEAPPMTVIVEPRKLIVGDPKWVAYLMGRLKNGSPELNLERWRTYRKDKLASGVVFIPQKVDRISSNMIFKIAYFSVKDKLAPAQGIYGGISATWNPAGVEAELLFDNDDAAWNRQQEKGFLEWKKSTLKEIDEDLTSVKELLDFINASSTDDHFIIRASLNSDLVSQVQKVVQEVLQAVFSSFSDSGSFSFGEDDDQEKTVPHSEINHYRLIRDPDDLEPFDPSYDKHKNFSAITGPFGLYIKRLAINKENPDIMDMEIHTDSSIVPNIENVNALGSEHDIGGHLYITHIWSKSGKDLLREENCGSQRNALFQALGNSGHGIYKKEADKTPLTREYFDIFGKGKDFVWAKTLTGGKTVRLTPGTKINDIGEIEGYIRVRLPTRFKKEWVRMPFKNKVVNTDGVRVKMKESDEKSIGYYVSGEIHRLIDVRALNAEGKYLAWKSSSRSSGFGEGEAVTMNFRGKPQTAELVFATEIEEENFPFDFKFSRPGIPNRSKIWTPGVEPVSLKEFENQGYGQPDLEYCKNSKMATTTTGPFGLCLRDLEIRQKYYGENKGKDYVRGDIMVKAPQATSLRNNFSAIKMTITELEFKNKKTGKKRKLPVQVENFINLRTTSSSFDSKTLQVNNEEVVGVSGYLEIYLPTELSALKLDIAELGNHAENDLGLKVKLTEIADRELELEFHGPRERIVHYQPRDKQGQPLHQRFPQLYRHKKDEPWKGSLGVPPETETVDIVFAKNQERKKYPFKFKKPKK